MNPLPLDEFVSLDFETTGVVAGRDEIIEIGAIRFRAGREVEAFETLVRPARSLGRHISEKTGITMAMLADAPAIGDVREKFLGFLADAPIVAHQARFEVSFLRSVFGVGPREVYDTMILARAAGIPARGLSAVAAALGIDSPVWHRALPDARAAGLVYLALPAVSPVDPVAASPRRILPSRASIEETLSLLEEGLLLEEIASRRGLAASTIEGHFERLLSTGRIPIERVLPAERISAARAAWEAVGWEGLLTPAYEAGGGKIPYRDLRWLRAWRMTEKVAGER